MSNAQETSTFQPGRYYFCRSVCDHSCVWVYRVVRRTAKSVWISEVRNGIESKPARKAISHWRGEEQCKPSGSYSMAPILGAERVASEELVASRTQPRDARTAPRRVTEEDRQRWLAEAAETARRALAHPYGGEWA